MLLHDLAIRYGPQAAFINVLGSSLGLPVPAMPTLIIVGATVAAAGMGGSPWAVRFVLFLSCALLGGLIGDYVWFLGGRRYGDKTLKMICKLSLSRDTCVKKTERFFGRWGVKVLLVARFIPGLSLVSVPLSGAMKIHTPSFFLHDAIGVALWSSVGLVIGVLFSAQLDAVFRIISLLGRQAILLAAVTLAAYVAYRYWRRAALMKKLATARISADELYALMSIETPPVILDIRSSEKRMLDPFVIAGSVHADERDLLPIVEAYQMDRKVVIYCSCPNEVSAAWMAKTLMDRGFKEVVPLTGGLDAWRLAGLGLIALTEGITTKGESAECILKATI